MGLDGGSGGTADARPEFVIRHDRGKGVRCPNFNDAETARMINAYSLLDILWVPGPHPCDCGHGGMGYGAWVPNAVETGWIVEPWPATAEGGVPRRRSRGAAR